MAGLQHGTISTLATLRLLDLSFNEATGKKPVDVAYQHESNKALELVHEKKFAEAIAIFEQIEKEHPGEYIIASNLGTAYELNGEPAKALHWIQEGIRRNPDSHYGSEWVHVKILEAKLAMLQDSRWLEKHSVLDLDFGSGEAPAMPVSLADSKDKQKKTFNSLEYQVEERFPFTSAPDPIFASLLFDLGNLAAFEMTVEHSVAIQKLALTFQPTNADLVKRRIAYFDRIAQKTAFKKNMSTGLHVLIYVGGSLALALWVISLKRRLEKKNAAKAPAVPSPSNQKQRALSYLLLGFLVILAASFLTTKSLGRAKLDSSGRVVTYEATAKEDLQANWPVYLCGLCGAGFMVRAARIRFGSAMTAEK